VQVVAEQRVAPQCIITCDLAVRHLLTPLVEHLQALIMPALILHRLWHMALLTPLRVSRAQSSGKDNRKSRNVVPKKL
jgi:hypothetical protein